MKHSWDKENWVKKDDIYYMNRYKFHRSQVGTNQKQDWDKSKLSRDSAKNGWDNLQNDVEGLMCISKVTRGETRTQRSRMIKIKRSYSLFKPRYGGWASHWVVCWDCMLGLDVPT